MNEDVINRPCVRITIIIDEKEVIYGTGTLIRGRDDFFVITAHHCVYGDKNIYKDVQLHEIKIESQSAFNAPFIPIEVEEITDSNMNDDWVIMKVKFEDHDGIHPNIFMTNSFKVEDSVLFTGFQAVNRNEFRTFKSRILNGLSAKEFRITLKKDDTFKGGADDAKGLSGSGAFILHDNKLYLIGILKNVKGDEAFNNDIKCCGITDIANTIGLKISEIILNVNNVKVVGQNYDPKIVLFNNFSIKAAPYYFDRKIDEEFNNNLLINNIWIYGDSGCGKTAFVNKNLIINNIKFCYCDLSPVTIKCADNVLEEIICTIEIKFDTDRNNKITNKVKQISDLLTRISVHNMVIVIDELSIRDSSLMKDIFDHLLKIVINYNNSNPLASLKFIISTIKNPNLIEEYPKATSYFHFVDCNDWENDIIGLFDIINSALNIDIESYKVMILESCAGSPRILKSIFRKLLLYQHINEDEVKSIIDTVKKEIIC